MAKVLAAIDLTPQGRRVAERARMVAEDLEAALSLVHVVETAPEALISDAVAGLLRHHRVEAARGLLEWSRSRSSEPVDLTTPKGSPAWEIVRAGKTATLTVVGASGLDAGRVGPVSRRVAEAAWGDVLVVRRQPRVPYRRVVVAVDLSEASRKAVELACRLGAGAEITLVFALPTRFDLLMADAGLFPEEVELNLSGRLGTAAAAMERFVASLDDRVKTVVADGPPVEVVEETVRRRSADLTVVASRGAGATRMVLLGTVAAGVLETVPSDVAVARVPGEFRRP